VRLEENSIQLENADEVHFKEYVSILISTFSCIVLLAVTYFKDDP